MSQETVAAQDMIARFAEWQGREPVSVAADATYGNGEFIQLADFGVPTIPQPNATVQPASIRPTPNCDVRPQDCWWPKQ